MNIYQIEHALSSPPQPLWRVLAAAAVELAVLAAFLGLILLGAVGCAP